MSLEWKLKRSNQDIMNIIVNILETRMGDPRMSFVTITSVDISPDMRNAKVYYSIYSLTDEEKEQAKTVFENARGFIQKEFSSRIKIKFTPKLNFIYDDSPEQVDYLNRLFKRLNDERRPEQD
ncbi:MAG: 30S ribosome-binding factor RbfA [Candidatus Muirbacterium halophilum]|nr:30S ribosome-binding factor RbfA [Candidatus Muirbacterium halophilum]MCK9475679.1 30S ribosome-binding factor RbfA [Candidatus Muirbacterium halophilum]